MINLKSKIDESLFDGKSDEDIARNVNKLGKIARYCYSKNKNIFDGLTGNVRSGSKGIEIYAPMFPGNKMINHDFKFLYEQEFVIESTAKKLDLGISKFRGNMTIHCRNLETLEGIFTPDCEFKGRLILRHMWKLKSIKGLPKSIEIDPEIQSSYHNGYLYIYECSVEPTADQIEYLPIKASVLWWEFPGSTNVSKIAKIREMIIAHTKGLSKIRIQGRDIKI